MTSRSDNLETRGSSFALLSRREWVYLLSLLIPFVVYDLALKVAIVISRPEDSGASFKLMWADLLFDLGYVMLWAGLFAVARKGLARWILVGLFHVMTVVAALLTTSAYQYFKTTGSPLDLDYILIWLSSPGGTGGVIASEFDPVLVVLVVAILAYAFLGPALVSRLVDRGRGRPAGARRAGIAWLRLTGVGLAAYALFSFSLLLVGGPVSVTKFFPREGFVEMVMTAADGSESEEPLDVASGSAGDSSQEESLVSTGSEERRNVVMIFLESTRAGATTPYNEGLQTTPFLDEMARSSLLVERAYAVVPHTHNALTATNCGIEPPLDRWGTKLLGARDDSVPSRCLAELLNEQGYNTAYFMSQAQTFERSPNILANLGYEEFYAIESMDTEGFEQTNYFGYEDDVMLEPSERWLRQNRDEPFLATYLTSAPHHDYLAPRNRYGREEFTGDDTLNRYLNSVRQEDFFLENLFEQYKELGLYEETVFIILGDHGEGFGEHDRWQHDNVPYEEGLRIPMLIHDPGQFQDGARLKSPANQLDILPTVADLLGYDLEGEAYSGSSLLGPISKNRTLMFSCWNEKGCLASLEGTRKYIYHFDERPEEIFDLSQDPFERQNLAEGRPEEAEQRRQELLEWREEVHSGYGTEPAE